MRMHFSLVLAALLFGCSERTDTPALAYKSPSDMLLVGLGLDGLFGDACYRDEGRFLSFIGMEECYRFLPTQRMRGVWRDEFEGSEFFPGATTTPADDAHSDIWLDVERYDPLPPPLRRDPEGSGTRYLELDFIGRRTQYPGSYGHMGLSRHYVVVQRILSARELP